MVTQNIRINGYRLDRLALLIFILTFLIVSYLFIYQMGRDHQWKDIVKGGDKSLYDSYVQGKGVDFYDKNNDYIISCNPYYNSRRPR